VQGLRASVRAAIDHSLATLEAGEGRAPPVPEPLLAQARLSAHSAVGLDTVLRRYFAGNALFGDFIVEEAEEGGLLGGAALKRLLRVQANLFDNLVATIVEEYAREAEARPGSAGQRRAERVERLLAGELIDTAELSYQFDAHHLGLIAVGPGASEAVRELAAPLDARLLLVSRGEETVWAWIGARRGVEPGHLEPLLRRAWPCQVLLALGEPGQGITGWRLTHRQARAALPIAQCGEESIVRYAEVALLASVLQDDLLAASLHQLYLAPLERERDGGEVARETLRAYFSAGRNVSSAAAALGVNRRTVSNRLRAIDERLGRQLSGAEAEMEAALWLEGVQEGFAQVRT
jgi:hypothetical protein